MIKLSLPIILGQVGLMLIGAGDVYIASLHSTQAVGSIGVANSFVNPILLFGVGLMMGISPSLSIERGEGKKAYPRLLSLLVYGLSVGFTMTFLTLISYRFIPMLGIDKQMIPSIIDYCRVIAWSFPFAIAFNSLKEYLQSKEEVFFPNLLSLLSVAFNLVINYIFVFGILDYKGVGEIGLAYASLVTRLFMFLVLFFYVYSKEKFGQFDLSFVRKLIKFSLPIAIMFFFEVAAFCLVGILGGQLGVVEAATNNIVLTLASIAFMVPMSISGAATVKVGHSYGASNYDDLISNIYSAIMLVFCYSIISSLVFMFLSFELMSLMSSDQNVIKLGSLVLFIVGIFQFSDGLQVIFGGILRGMKRVKVCSYLILAGFWFFGIPLGYYLTFNLGYNLKGLWIGLAIALSFVAIFLALYLVKTLKQEKARMIV